MGATLVEHQTAQGMTLIQTRRLVLSPRVIQVMCLPKGWTYTCFQLCKLLEPEKSSLISTATRVENGKSNCMSETFLYCTKKAAPCFIKLVLFISHICLKMLQSVLHFLHCVFNQDSRFCLKVFPLLWPFILFFLAYYLYYNFEFISNLLKFDCVIAVLFALL